MPRGTCAECGLRDVLGPGLAEDEAFLCCDCDIELNVYSRAERADPQKAGCQRGRRAAEQVTAASPLQAVIFDPGTSADFSCPAGVLRSPLELLCDPSQDLFAGVGSKVWPAAVPLARQLAILCGSTGARHRPPPRRVVEVGAGCGAVGLWLWQAYYPRLEVCLTDLPRFSQLLRINADRVWSMAGHAPDKPAVDAPLVRPLRWGLLDDLSAFAGEAWDLLIGSDVCYSREKVEPLMHTIAALEPRCGAVLALSMDNLRGPGAEALRERCEERKWMWQELGREEACDGKEVLVVLVTASRGTS